MSSDDPIARLFNLFADLLEYPTPALARQATNGVEWLAELHPQAAARLEQFQRSVEEIPTGRMEEIYTRTFDMQPVSYPYVGYHLFGESYKRGAFMAQLNEGYRKNGFSPGNELPDHVAVILRFLASSMDQADNPYSAVVSALSLVIKGIASSEANGPEEHWASFAPPRNDNSPEKEMSHV